MKLIDEIISELTDSKGSLETAFLKTKVLAYKLENYQLVNWINNELNGYNSVEAIPEYRIIPCMVFGSMTNGYNRYTNFQIPISHIRADIRKELEQVKLPQNVSALEHLINDNNEETLSIPLGLEFVTYIINNNIPTNGYHVETAEKKINKASVKQIVSSIRSKLLDFLLEVNKEMGDKELTESNKRAVDKIFTTTIYGDNNVVISGDSNSQNVNINSTKGDLGQLKEELLKNGIEPEDIHALEKIIDIDDKDDTNQILGLKVNSWMKNMLAKAVDGGWKISIGAAGGVLAHAIYSYYGWK